MDPLSVKICLRHLLTQLKRIEQELPMAKDNAWWVFSLETIPQIQEDSEVGNSSQNIYI